MEGVSRKWMILAATIWIQAFTGTNFDFSAYSCELKFALGLSQVQLNYLATASDLGKAFGWCSGLALNCLPVWLVMFISAFLGLVGYGLQWLVIRNIITLPYFVVFLLCLLAGCSICWFNTVCFVLCVKNFPSNRPLALALTVSFNGLSGAIYNLAAEALNPSSRASYLLLNAFLPLLTSIAALVPILYQSPPETVSPPAAKREQSIFSWWNLLAGITGLYLLFLHSTDPLASRFIFFGAICLLVFPLGAPVIFYARHWFCNTSVCSIFNFERPEFTLVDAEDHELHRSLISGVNKSVDTVAFSNNNDRLTYGIFNEETESNVRCCKTILEKDRLLMIGEEHKAQMLVRRLDFWLYYVSYFCGGTIGLVYSNNLGQIAESLGHTSQTTTLITLYSSFSFFGRLLSAAPDFIKTKFYFARTGWMAMMLLPTPVAFFLLATASSGMALIVATSFIGLSSGFLFAAAVSITSELFGANSMGVNHNILITNIPIGSLVYGVLAATIYDANGSSGIIEKSKPVVCMGRECYYSTLIWWGCISVLGLASSLLLFLRTRPAYDRFEQNQISTKLYREETDLIASISLGLATELELKDAASEYSFET